MKQLNWRSTIGSAILLWAARLESVPVGLGGEPLSLQSLTKSTYSTPIVRLMCKSHWSSGGETPLPFALFASVGRFDVVHAILWDALTPGSLEIQLILYSSEYLDKYKQKHENHFQYWFALNSGRRDHNSIIRSNMLHVRVECPHFHYKIWLSLVQLFFLLWNWRRD